MQNLLVCNHGITFQISSTKLSPATQGEAAEKTLRIRGQTPARGLQKRLLPGRGRVRVRLQGEVQDNGESRAPRIRAPDAPLTRCVIFFLFQKRIKKASTDEY